MKTGAAYIRVSTDEQLELSPESQRDKILEYAKENEIELPDAFLFQEDEGRSGRSANHRPEFMRMIGVAKRKPKPFDVILVWKFSRFARSREDSVIYKSMLRRECGIDVVSVSEGIGNDKTSVLFEGIIETMDEWYSINLSEEVVRGMSQKAKRGGVVSSPAYGYLVKQNAYLPDPERAPVVLMIFERFANTNSGYKTLAGQLNALGFRTRKGGLFESRTILQILTNPVYIGTIRWNPGKKPGQSALSPGPILAEGSHQPIVPRELWDAAQEKVLALKSRYPRYARHSSGMYLLQGLVRCSSCKSTLVRCNHGLQCHSYAKGSCKESHYIGLERLSGLVLSSLEKAFAPETLVSYPSVSIQNSAQAPAIKRQISRAHLKLERAQTAYEENAYTLEEYCRRKKSLLDEIACLKRHLAQEQAAVLPVSGAQKGIPIFAALCDPAFPQEEKNGLLRSFFKYIVFDRVQNEVKIYLYV